MSLPMTNDLKLKYNLSNVTHKPYNVYQEWDKTRASYKSHFNKVHGKLFMNILMTVKHGLSSWPEPNQAHSGNLNPKKTKIQVN